ncbi:MAG: DUF2090 domain-containing protein [Pseudomonadota bacterium]
MIADQAKWVAQRGAPPDVLRIFAFDHRSQFEEMPGATPQRIGRFKRLCLKAAVRVQNGRSGHGILCDGRLGADALRAAADTGLWIGRPSEWPGSRPLSLEPEVGPDGAGVACWPKAQTVKCLCFCHPDDPADMWAAQEATVLRLFQAARSAGLSFLLEVIPSKCGPVDDDTTARVIQRFYDLGVCPDWWKLEPFTTSTAWSAAVDAIARNDPHVCGIVVLGLDAPEAALADSFALAARQPLVRGFAVGRTIFGDVARDWMLDRVTDADAVQRIAANYDRLCAIWDAARTGHPHKETRHA